MKNIKINKLFPLIGLVFILFSCHDRLDQIEGQSSADDTDYTNTENMIEPLYAAYAQFTQRGWEDVPLYSVRGDDVNAGGLGDQQPFADTDRYVYAQDYWMYNSVWQNLYKDIVDVNNTIEQINLYLENADSDADRARGDQYIAEAKVLRGFMNLQLVRLFSDVFIVVTSQPADELADGVASKETVLNFIVAQMDEAIPALPDLRPNERADLYGGVTKHTAYAIKALAQLELSDYNGVAQATNQIISSGRFHLYDDYYQLFKMPGELSDESLLEIQYSDYNSPDGPSTNYLNAFYGPQGWSPVVENIGGGWGFYEPSMKFIKFMLDRGEYVRLETSVLFSPRGIAAIQEDPNYANLPSWVSNQTPSGDVINDYNRAMFASGKHYLPSEQIFPGRTSYASGKNMIVIRYAEILLMYAEALTQGASGGAMTADQAVNMVRERADLAPISGVTLEDVLDEKFAEFGMEWGVRFYDMARLGRNDELSYDGRTYTADKRYLPYPQNQIDQIPSLGDN